MPDTRTQAPHTPGKTDGGSGAARCGAAGATARTEADSGLRYTSLQNLAASQRSGMSRLKSGSCGSMRQAGSATSLPCAHASVPDIFQSY